MSTRDTTGRTALVTGASSGIGREIADIAAADGYDLVVTARREERLRELAEAVEADHGVSATVLPQDLAEPDAADRLYEAVRDAGIDIDVLVNNAGVPLYGPFAEVDRETERDMLRVNVTTPTELTRLFLPAMVDRGRGGVLNTASLTAFYPVPRKAVYGATKSYLLSFSRAIAHEVEDDGVTVTALCPGVVETEYAERGNVEESGTMSGVTNDPRSVAEAGWDGFRDGERIVLPSAIATYAAQLTRVLPRKTVTGLGEQTIEDGASWI